MTPTTKAGKAHAEAWIDAVEIEWGLGEGDRETMLGEVAAIEVEAVAVALSALRDALDGLVKAAEGSLVASGGHMDSGWNDVIGATQSWHDCLPNASALRAALAKAKGTP